MAAAAGRVDEQRRLHRFARELDAQLEARGLTASMHVCVADQCAYDDADWTMSVLATLGVAQAFRERRDATDAELQRCSNALAHWRQANKVMGEDVDDERSGADRCPTCHDEPS